ncbi:phosphatidylinositol kinase [Bordetella sp. H567]|uniref:type II toxin-antitoxin system HipA family toxin n=1 Tax=Bordetella sp. H567 TaxID=1697043 RepID=UPI00081CB895|nr:type II toxin-antitoxin system HipA family toxin [Bordetella sp. H567]AOB31247.1 phosphatidylinositol kinase [Bordetella sp. H567]
MNVKALEIRLGKRRVGILFQYALSHDQVINRFVADERFARDPHQPALSYSFLAGDPQAQAAFWAGVTAPQLNGALSDAPDRGWLLPAFFQNLLPEGPLRTRIAELRGCDPNDHFELLAATGKDLPGDVHALPARLTRAELTRYIAQDNDALEMSVVEAPLDDGISISGVQAKLAVLKQGDRFVARTKLKHPRHVRHVIAKLPVAQYPLLPELEHLSLQMAAASGVSVVESELAPLERLAVEHGYELGDVNANTRFLAVYRYDRDADTPTGRVHCEDFAQILDIQPEHKYTLDYLTIAGVMMAIPSLGEAAVHELLRRILVSDLMGNPDMHLKNIGLRYPDGRTAELPPAYDLVGYAAYGIVKKGRALRLVPRSADSASSKAVPAADPAAPLTPVVVRDFCARLGLPEKPAWAALRQCAAKAFDTWPALIAQSTISEQMKARLVARLQSYHSRKP